MIGSKTGVVTRMIKEKRCAVFINCIDDAFNLAVGDTLIKSTNCKLRSQMLVKQRIPVKFSAKNSSLFDRI